MTAEKPLDSEDQRSFSEKLAPAIATLVVWKGREAIDEISAYFGLWQTSEGERILDENPEIKEMQGKRLERKLIDVFYQEMTQNGAKIPKGWKKEILKRYQDRSSSS